jgi:hypothetical protein
MRVSRRIALRTVAALAVPSLALVAGPLFAQDPRASAAVAASNAWLALVDKGDLEASYAAAGQRFRGAVKVPEWKASLAKARDPRGPLVQRSVLSSRFETKPGSEAQGIGDIAILVYRTSFAKQTDTRETVTLEREPDAWRVVGYFIH